MGSSHHHHTCPAFKKYQAKKKHYDSLDESNDSDDHCGSLEEALYLKEIMDLASEQNNFWGGCVKTQNSTKVPLGMYMVAGAKSIIPLMINENGNRVLPIYKKGATLTVESSFDGIYKYLTECKTKNNFAIFVTVPGYKQYSDGSTRTSDSSLFVRQARCSSNIMRAVFKDRSRHRGIFREKIHYCCFIMPPTSETIQLLKESCPNLLESFLAHENFLITVVLPYPTRT